VYVVILAAPLFAQAQLLCVVRSNCVTRLSGVVVLDAERRGSMTVPRTQQMIERLKSLRMSTPDVEASAVVSVDGLTIASDLPADTEEDRVSAMSAAMLSLGERIATELGRGTLEQVYIRGDEGYVFLTSVGEDAVLTVLAGQEAKLGLVFLDMRRAAEDLSTIV
jgi:hypothetical protein